jgi:hypothetical protein
MTGSAGPAPDGVAYRCAVRAYMSKLQPDRALQLYLQELQLPDHDKFKDVSASTAATATAAVITAATAIANY